MPNDSHHSTLPPGTSFVYLLKHASDPCLKIGKADCIHRRADTLGSEKFDFGDSWAVRVPDAATAYRLERALASVFHRFNVARPEEGDGRSEWYDASCIRRALTFVEHQADLFGATVLRVSDIPPTPSHPPSDPGRRAHREVKTRRSVPTTQDGRERQAWRLPRGVLRFLRAEAVARGTDVTHLVIQILGSPKSYYELPRAAVMSLEEDRAALRMRRWGYLHHCLHLRARMVAERGPGFDAPRARSTGVPMPEPALENLPGEGKALVGWNLPEDLRALLREEARERQLELSRFAVALVDSYASFHPLPAVLAEHLQQDREATGLDRREYFRHLWTKRQERVDAEGVGFDDPLRGEPLRGEPRRMQQERSELPQDGGLESGLS